MKEDLKRKEQIKEAAKKRQEKLDDLEAKKRIRAKIEADREERRRKAEEAKAARDGLPPQTVSLPAAPAAAAAATGAAKTATTAARTEARLRLQVGAAGTITKTLPVETTLFELAQMVQEETGVVPTSFSTTFPRKVYEGNVDFGKTLKEAGLVPSAVLIMK